MNRSLIQINWSLQSLAFYFKEEKSTFSNENLAALKLLIVFHLILPSLGFCSHFAVHPIESLNSFAEYETSLLVEDSSVFEKLN